MFFLFPMLHTRLLCVNKNLLLTYSLTTQWLTPTVLYTYVDGQYAKLVTETVNSLPHWSSN